MTGSALDHLCRCEDLPSLGECSDPGRGVDTLATVVFPFARRYRSM